MRTVIGSVLGQTGRAGTLCLLAAVLVFIGTARTAQAVPADDAKDTKNKWHATLENPPPADQTYTGIKACASCHFDQYMKWKKSKHAVAFDVLTAKYQKDEKCIKCHTTGYGEPTGFTSFAATPQLAGTGCEKCHGPGSIHEKIAQKYAKVKTLTPEQDKEVRGSTWLVLPKNVCIECQLVQGHKDSATPKEMQPKSATAAKSAK